MANGNKRRVRDQHEARQLLALWEQSGERMSDWCGQRGITWYSLSAFKGRLEQEEIRFVEVELAEQEQEQDDDEYSTYRIGLRNGVSIEVDDDFSDHTLRRLLGVVGSC